jgi:Xaa-Pro dipeptidase
MSASTTTTPTVLDERDGRYARLRAAMADAGLDGLLAYAPAWRREDVRYLTGAPLRGAFGFAYLPASGEPAAFVAEPGDVAAIRRAGLVSDVQLMGLPRLEPLADRLRADGQRTRIGIAHHELLPAAIADALARALPDVRFESASKLTARVRLVKSEWELAQLRDCATLCDDGWEAFLRALAPGVSEYEIIAEVEASVKAAGAEDNFMIIASGGAEVRGMTPPSTRRLQPGDMVRTELTPQSEGYWAQICRTAVLGSASDAQRASFELFEEATAAGIAAVRPGVTAHDVAKAENDVFRARGYGEYCTSEYTRVRGHGHGLHLDEVPIIEGEETVLEAGAVLIVHPNTYTPLAGYHVLGDPVIVTPTGSAPLLRTPRRLDEVPV